MEEKIITVESNGLRKLNVDGKIFNCDVLDLDSNAVLDQNTLPRRPPPDSYS